MPFPLAHPAAVLPLKRYCPRFLSFPALIIGSLIPDSGYCLGIGNFAHTFFPGSLAFCLPAGLLALALLYAIRWRLVQVLPATLRSGLLPLCLRPPGSPLAIAVSVVVGVWMHLGLDSVTHLNSRLVSHAPLLRGVVLIIGARKLRVYDALYIGSTYLGVAWLAWSYLRWLEAIGARPSANRKAVDHVCTMLFAALILGIALRGRRGALHHGADLASIAWAFATGLAVMGFFFVTRKPDATKAALTRL